MKLGLTFKMTLQGFRRTYTPSYPLTVDFDVTRSTRSSANPGRFTVYNLKESTRGDVRLDYIDTQVYRHFKFEAGYVGQPTLPVVFQGNVMQAGSARRGTEWMTDIEVLDGGYGIINGQVNTTLKTWTPASVFDATVGAMPNIAKGVVGRLAIPSSRGKAMADTAWGILAQLAAPDGEAFIDLERANLIRRDEYVTVASTIPEISAATGLLGTPKLQNGVIYVETLFEPRAQPGQLCKLLSLDKVYNNTYKVVEVRHRGRISAAVESRVTTTVGLWFGAGSLTGVAR